MKGYAQTPVNIVQQAIENCQARYNMGPAVRDMGIALYYQKHYVNGSGFHKWWHRKETPEEYVRSQMGPWSTWDDILCDVLGETQLDILSGWCWGRGRESAKACKALIRSTDQDYVLLGEELASFVEAWRNV